MYKRRTPVSVLDVEPSQRPSLQILSHSVHWRCHDNIDIEIKQRDYSKWTKVTDRVYQIKMRVN